MITQLEIKNFRGFSEYKIDDVGQVNLLVGTNNCGKTSVLEAIHLLKSRGRFSEYVYSIHQRGEHSEKSLESSDNFRSLFYGFKFSLLSAFAIQCNNDEMLVTSVIKDDNNRVNLESSKENCQFHIIYCLRKIQLESIVNFNGREIRQTQQADSSITPHDDDVKFVPALSLSPQKVVSLFEKIVLTPDEELILEAVRIIEPNIIRLASLGGNNSSVRDHARGGIFVKSSKWEERISIGSFGDGIWRLLGLALSLIAAKNGTLLIDEIDTGLHHTVMSKMWKLICATAKKLNVQVFATTHSRDCWETLADNAIEDEFADMPIRIHRINKDKKRATTFTNEEMHLALNRDVEVR